MEGAEPASFDGGPDAALVVHGFTGSPQSMRGLAAAFADAGFAVELPLLPGHGTSLEDMKATGWADWSSAVESAYVALREKAAGQGGRVVVAGLSMGGTLATWLGARHPEIAGLVLINPAVEPPDPSLVDMLSEGLAAGADELPAIGSDIALPGVAEVVYAGTPVAPLLSLFEAQADLAGALGEIRCPVLLMTSPQDHVVAPSASDFLAARVAGPVERVVLERSFHVATLDFDRALIEERAVDFAREVCGS